VTAPRLALLVLRVGDLARSRVFYEALGHSEHIYAMTPIMEHLLAGIQYALGDLPANDSPSVK